MKISFQKFVFRLVPEPEKGIKQGTAFLISPHFALTARHNLEKRSSAKEVLLEIDKNEIKAEIIDIKFDEIDAILLKLKEDVKAFSIPEIDFITDIEKFHDSKWKSFGFPNNYHKHLNGSKITVVKNKLWDADIDLDSRKLEGYGGLSGAPVIANDKIIGLIKTDVPNNQLGIVSMQRVKKIIDIEQINSDNLKSKNQMAEEEEYWKKIINKCDKNKFYFLNIEEFQSFLIKFPNSVFKDEAAEIIKQAKDWFESIDSNNFNHFKLKHSKTKFNEYDFKNRYFYLALKNIWVHGDTDIFPFPIENRIFKDRTEEVINILVDLDKRFTKFIKNIEKDIVENKLFSYMLPNKSIIETAIPIGYTGFRWATQIEPIWNAYYLYLVLSIAGEIEKKREKATFSKSFFSYRFNPDYDTGDIFKRRKGFQFWEKTESLLIEYVGVS